MSEPDPELLERMAALLDQVDDRTWVKGPDAMRSKPYDDILDTLDHGIYDRQGRPISVRQWSELHANFDYKVIVRTFTNHAFISTVWLGMDHGYGWLEESRPLIFETMIFPRRRRDRHAAWAEDTYRWSTLEEARRGHEGLVNKIRNRGMNAIRTKAQEREWEAQWPLPITKTKRQSSSARRTATTSRSRRTRRA